MEETQKVLVIIADSHLTGVKEVAASLSAHDFKLHEIMSDIGIISGRVCPSRLGEILQLEGIDAIEQSGSKHALSGDPPPY